VLGDTAPLSDQQRDRSTLLADDDLFRLTDDEKTALAALLKRTKPTTATRSARESARCGAFSRNCQWRWLCCRSQRLPGWLIATRQALVTDAAA
jgi:hypothetical protein